MDPWCKIATSAREAEIAWSRFATAIMEDRYRTVGPRVMVFLVLFGAVLLMVVS